MLAPGHPSPKRSAGVAHATPRRPFGHGVHLGWVGEMALPEARWATAPKQFSLRALMRYNLPGFVRQR